MSTGRRAYDILRGYVNREWDRIQGLERSDALRELEDSLDPASPEYRPTPRPKLEDVPPADAKTHARHILGVNDAADFEEIRGAFDKLSKRSDPSRFPEESAESRQAADIQRKIYWAYSVLTEDVDTTERRFRSLEID